MGCVETAQERKEKEVVQWLKRMEQDPCDALKRWGVLPYSSHDEWVEAGRKIEGVEQFLITLLETNRHRKILNGWEVISGLAYVGSPNSVPALIKVLEDRSEPWDTRAAAAMALGHIGDTAAVEPLCALVSSDEEGQMMLTTIKINAMHGLLMIGDRRGIPVIEKALENQAFPNYRETALSILERLKEKQKLKDE